MKRIAILSALPILAALAAPAFAEGDATKGEAVFKKCMACHSVKDKTKKVGPHLQGVIGRAIGSVEGFKYSASMMEYAATAVTWDDAKFLAYIENPKKDVPKGTMAFGGIKDAAERDNLLAYLKTITVTP